MAVLGTAGHVDHGKTTLVRALTGIDTDRLPEEKRRGITIELGFAPLEVTDPDGGKRTVAIVDVPGHERFVGTMVAGAQGVDVALLVVAADAGVMPQTREHLLVLAGLGVRTLLVALTRSDLADEETRALCRLDVEEALARTPWPAAPIFEVSGKTGAGLDALRAAIAVATSNLSLAERRARPARLAIDRAFTPRGQGVVVTGTLVAGTLSVGDELALLPGTRSVRVRGLHQHGVSVSRAQATGRVAVALAGVELSDLHRGEILAPPGSLSVGRAFDAVFTRASGGRPFGRRARIAFHIGTDEVVGRLVPIAKLGAKLEDARSTMAGGEVWLVRAVLVRPGAFAAGDRVVARADGPLAAVGTTLGYLTILRVAPGRLLGGRAQYAEVIGGLAEADEQARATLEIEAAGLSGLGARDLAVRLPSRKVSKELAKSLAPLEVRGGGSAWWVSVAARERARVALIAHVDRWHAAHPDDDAVPLAVALAGVPSNSAPGLAEATLERAIGERALVRDGDRVRSASFVARARADDPKALALADLYAEGAMSPPTMTEAARTLGLEIPRARALAQALGPTRIVHVQGDLWFDAKALDGLVTRVVAFLEARGTMTTSDLKELVGASRKYLVPLAEWLDARKVTLRVGDVRKLRR